MTSPSQPSRKHRRDGWTLVRRQQFLADLAAGLDVRRAAARVGMARETAYRLRRREAGFARAWDEALAAARAAEDRAFLADMPERLRRKMAEMSGACDLAGPEFYPRTVSALSGPCDLRGASLFVCGPSLCSGISMEDRRPDGFAKPPSPSLRSGFFTENSPPGCFP